MSSLIVAKFGGTSMATGRSFGIVGERVARNDDMRVVVVSAPGAMNDTNDPAGKNRDAVKVTNRLIGDENKKIDGIVQKVRKNEPLEEDIQALTRRYGDIEDAIGIPQSERISGSIRERVLERIKKLDHGNPKYDAPLGALGEELNARLFASYLRMIHVRARYLDPMDAGFTVSSENGKVFIDDAVYGQIQSKVQRILDEGERIVFPGYFGYDSAGVIRTFQRGGSDYTGAVLAAALKAGLYQNFTDTDGIRVVEPTIANDAPIIRAMTHRELTELTLGGAFGVFQYEAAVPLAISGVVTQVLNTFDPCSKGTYILPQVGSSERDVTGVVHRGEFVAFEVVKYGIANAVGFFRDMLKLFSDMKISVEHAPSSTNDISVIVRKKSMEDAGLTSGDVAERIRKDMSPHDIKIHGISEVAMVGEELSRTRGLGMKILGAVSEAGVNVPYHSHQGISFILWLRNGDAEIAAKAIYRSQFNSGNGKGVTSEESGERSRAEGALARV
jgi:aspartate kinase